jgi:hypothetical protein
MVRLVFRAYTQVRGAICTSASQRAPTRVSSGFALFRHGSPSFGSELEVGHFGKIETPPQFAFFAFNAPFGFHTLRLAAVLDSSVRVSRRVALLHFACILTQQAGSPH